MTEDALGASSAAADVFENSRGRLEAIAYRLLGSAADAEDAVQDTYLRWHAADRGRVEVPEAWLTKVLTNVCLNQLDSARVRRESYVGQWLPEPVLTGDRMLGPADTVERRESVSLALLTLLERLSPHERAVYVLREAFQYSHREIAGILELSEANCQQIYRRAKEHVTVGHTRAAVDAAAARRIAAEFLAAVLSGDTGALVRLLTGDVVSVADGGGHVPVRTRVEGALAIARYLCGLARPTAVKTAIIGGRPLFHIAEVNDAPAVLLEVGGRIVGAYCLDITAAGIAELRIQANPGKLERLSRRWAATGPHRPAAQW
ncbi:RNA polymerase sigma factor SigJ [Nocardia sp. alder85J]|uniref:RNA polymerase sigma factor SigJ n=1 Tax=Nocardia sp. alder85J TaxID=2862949 RepID=UPI001CD4D386|nr:RNA polymerase sigma factor SigJ [Nocardia sp. alder85J]MCX4096837.1 RNA polymerase sigma factor SigJ [Nocardia sp. alder85J]